MATFGGSAFGNTTFGSPATGASAFSSFGQPQQQQQQQQAQFGMGTMGMGTTFGQAAPGTSTAFGTSTFGTPAATSFPAFGQPQQQQQQQQQQQPAQQFGMGTMGMGSTFGQANPSAFGTSTFGTPAATTSAFGSTAFGQPQQQQQQPATNFSFGTPATTSQFSFSQPTAGATGTSTFGQPATSTTSSGFGFGSFPASQPTAQAQPQQSLFGTPTSQPQQQTASLFGTTATAPQSTFGTGTGATQQGAFGASAFGQPQQQQPQTTSLFGQTSQAQPSFGTTFGSPAAGTAPLSTFGSFGAQKPATAFSFQPSFGQTSLFGQPQQQPQLGLQFQMQQPQPQINESEAFQSSVFQCRKFGDERDGTLAGLNYLQACWGAGKGYYSQTHPPANFNQQNAFYRFKAVGYAFVYTDNNEDGQVVINFKKPQDKVNAEESHIVSCMQTLLHRPNITIRFTGTKAISEEATVAIIFAEDRTTLRRVPATDMAAALIQPHLKAQLENLGVTNVNPKVKPSPEQLKRYYENPPEGIDPRVWTQAQEDNPDKNSMIPVPLIGVEALKSRIDWQEKETQQHHARLKLVGENVTTLLNRHANMSAELLQMRRKHVTLTHRLISIICRQELMRKQGTTLQPEEEMIKKKMEEMDTELNSPTQYKGRLNELLSQIRLHKSSMDSRSGGAKYNVDPSTLVPVKDFLSIQQQSVKHLVATTKGDFENLKEMMEELRKLANKSS